MKQEWGMMDFGVSERRAIVTAAEISNLMFEAFVFLGILILLWRTMK